MRISDTSLFRLAEHPLDISLEDVYAIAQNYPSFAVQYFAALLPNELLEECVRRAPMHALVIQDLLSKEMKLFILDEAVKRHFGGKKDELLPSQ